jgi:hypothetical protein
MAATVEELLEVVLTLRSVPRLHNEGQLPLEGIRKEGWCEMAASLGLVEWTESVGA